MDSYDVRFWDIRKLGNGSGARFRVRRAVDGREQCKSFKGRPLADGFLDGSTVTFLRRGAGTTSTRT